MRTIFFSLLILANFLIVIYAPPSFGANLPRFTAETAAQQHCPDDEVVWLNTNSGIWHSQRGRWYGRTKSGVYVCKKEAAAAGNRGSLNEG